MRRFFQDIALSRWLRIAPVGLLSLSLLFALACFDDGEKEHEFVLTKTGVNVCKLADANGNESLRVLPGEWVVFVNQTGQDIELEFAAGNKLFGVFEAKLYATGDPLKLRIRSDADPMTHDIRSANCPFGLPGPVIIIPPPN